MENWIKFCSESKKVVRIIMAALYVPTLLVRLFTCILEKWKDSSHIVMFVLQLIPIIGQIIYIIDIVFAALGRPFILCLTDINKDYNKADPVKEEKVIDVDSSEK